MRRLPADPLTRSRVWRVYPIPHDTEAALADLLQQLVAANTVAGLSRERARRRESNGWLKELAGLVVRGEQRIRLPAQVGVTAASLLQERRPLLRRQFARGVEDLFETAFLVGRHIHLLDD